MEYRLDIDDFNYSNELLLNTLKKMKYEDILLLRKPLSRTVLEIEVEEHEDTNYDTDERYRLIEFDTQEFENYRLAYNKDRGFIIRLDGSEYDVADMATDYTGYLFGRAR